MGATAAGIVEMVAADPSAAEHHLREAYEAYRATGERGYLSTVAGVLAEALYAQGQLDEAQQLTEEAQEAAVALTLRHDRWLRPTREIRSALS
jgi:hypothetical protein